MSSPWRFARRSTRRSEQRAEHPRLRADSRFLRPLRLLEWCLLSALAPAIALAQAGPPVRSDVDPAAAEAHRERGPFRAEVKAQEELAAGARLFDAAKLQRSMSSPQLPLIPMGPFPIPSEFWSGGAPAAGRVSAILLHPSDVNIAYAAAAQGGVWKTVDGGNFWWPITPTLSSQASGALAFEPSDPNILYYATGEQHHSLDSFYGDGVFRSVDAGITWSRIATSAQSGSYVARFVLSPFFGGHWYIAGSRGVVRSLDGGGSWSVVLSPGGRWCEDLVIDDITGDLYAAIATVGIHRSSDGGNTWTLLTGGLPTSGFDRINLGMSPSTVWGALFASFVATSGSLLGLYVSYDGGLTWTQRTNTPNYLASIGWYCNTLAVDPFDLQHVVAGGVYPYPWGGFGVIESFDGGLSWTDITFGSSTKIHPDQHMLAFSRVDRTLWVANDGGVWKRPLFASDWINCNQSLDITQFYTVAQLAWPGNANRIAGGTQDNGTLWFEPGFPQPWRQIVAGDGGPVDIESPVDLISSTPRFENLWNWGGIPPMGPPVDLTGPWVAAGDRADWAQGGLLRLSGGIIFVGTHRIWRSPDLGATWTAVTGDIAGGTGTVLCVYKNEGPPVPNPAIWASTSTGRVYRSTDEGLTWVQRSTGLPAGLRIPDVIGDDDTYAYAIVDRATGGRVYRTNDGGLSWASVTGNLPAGVRALSLASAAGRLFLGTDRGLYASVDGGLTWFKTHDSGVPLPDLAISDLSHVYDYNGGSQLILGTHGRGIWQAAMDWTGPATTVISPAHGQSWMAGSTRNITWTASDPAGVDSVSLILAGEGHPFYQTLASGIPNSGSFAWTIAVPANTYRVQVRPTDGWGNTGYGQSGVLTVTSTTAVEPGEPGPLRLAIAALHSAAARVPVRFRYSLSRAAASRIEIADLSGRRLATIAEGAHGAGQHEASWSGSDESGNAMPAGVYFVRLESEGRSSRCRIALLR